jgi:hypothetical protein
MDNLEISKFPIIILSTARTGSSALTNHLCLKYPKLKVWSEPDHNVEHLSDFIEYAKSKDDYIIKILSSSLQKYPFWFIRLKLLGKACHLIKLTRRSLIDQVASYYIALDRNTWHYYESDSNKWKYSRLKSINIDKELIENIINLIKTDIEKLKPFLYDDTFFYEDIKDNLKSPDLKTPKPANYKDLLNNIEDLLI